MSCCHWQMSRERGRACKHSFTHHRIINLCLQSPAYSKHRLSYSFNIFSPIDISPASLRCYMMTEISVKRYEVMRGETFLMSAWRADERPETCAHWWWWGVGWVWEWGRRQLIMLGRVPITVIAVSPGMRPATHTPSIPDRPTHCQVTWLAHARAQRQTVYKGGEGRRGGGMPYVIQITCTQLWRG